MPPCPAPARDRGRPHRPRAPTTSAARPRPRPQARGPQPHGGPLYGTGAAQGKRPHAAVPRRPRTPYGPPRPGVDRAPYGCPDRARIVGVMPYDRPRPRIPGGIPGGIRGGMPYGRPRPDRSRRQWRLHEVALAECRQVQGQRAPLQPGQHPRHLLCVARRDQQPHPVVPHGHRGVRPQMAQRRTARLGRDVQDVEAQAHAQAQRGSGGGGHHRPAQFVLVPPADLIARIERPTGKGIEARSVVILGRVPTMPSATAEWACGLRWV